MKKHIIYTLFALVAAGPAGAHAEKQDKNPAKTSSAAINETPDPKSSKFHAQELEATRLPIRPGAPGKTPFWNGFTKRFMYAPAFDFPKVKDAVNYKFTATDENGKTHTFTAGAPWAPLTPVWNDIAVGAVSLKVEGLDASGNIAGTSGERSFYRLAIFSGPYRGSREKTNTQAGVEGLRGLLYSQRFQYWLIEGKPYPGERHNCYPAKEMGASIRGMVLLSKLTDDKKESRDALQVARNIADYLIDHLTIPAGKPMEHMPFVYWLDPNRTVTPASSAQKNHDQTMLSEPTRAILGYMELYEACGNKKYLDAAVKAARTYVKIMRPDNTWPLMVQKESGEILDTKPVVPTWLMFMFNELDKKYSFHEFRKYADICEQWLMDNPVKTFAWDAQFEDIKIRPLYQNMSYEQGSDMAWYLLENYPDDSGKTALAEEILRFVEDQFVVWEKPRTSWYEKFKMPGGLNNKKRSIDNWILPATIEQYVFFPVCRATATVMKAYGKAYQVTRKDIYLAKAQSLAGTLAATQKHHGGGEFPTYPMTTENAIWTNNSNLIAIYMIQLDMYIKAGKRQ